LNRRQCQNHDFGSLIEGFEDFIGFGYRLRLGHEGRKSDAHLSLAHHFSSAALSMLFKVDPRDTVFPIGQRPDPAVKITDRLRRQRVTIAVLPCLNGCCQPRVTV